MVLVATGSYHRSLKLFGRSVNSRPLHHIIAPSQQSLLPLAQGMFVPATANHSYSGYAGEYMLIFVLSVAFQWV